MYLKTFDEMKKTSTFFMLKPINAIYVFIILICFTILSAIIWSIFAPMDDVVKATVLLRPSQSISSVKCVASGQLMIKNYSNDNDVIEGDLLFALDTSAFKTELDSYQKELKKNTDEEIINNTLLQTIDTSTLPEIEETSDAYIKAEAYITEKKRYEAILDDIQTKLSRENAKPETLRIPQIIQDLENQLEQSKLEMNSWIKKNRLEAIEKSKELVSIKKNIEIHISEIERNIKNSTIYAPISGRISEVERPNVGDYILAGEEILRIIPQDNESLKADIYVDPSYIARIKVGDLIRIKFPGLAPSRYGMIETKISLVPPDVTIAQNSQPVFIVEATIDNPYLYTKHGQSAKLLPGITAEARIITERSTAMQMILRKLDFIN